MLKKPLKLIQKGRDWSKVRQSHLPWQVGIRVVIPNTNSARYIVCTYMSLLNEVYQNGIRVQKAWPRPFHMPVAQLTQLPGLQVPWDSSGAPTCREHPGSLTWTC